MTEKRLARLRGHFITFEGGEGSGKSTHAATLAQRLKSLGLEVVLTREPGGTPLGERISDLLKWSKSVPLTPVAELLLFNASRAQLVREVIEPALAQGQVVLCDRFHDSTVVYQGTGRKISPETVAYINRIAVGNCIPDLTIVIDLDPRVGLERARGRELFDRMENQSLTFFQRVRKGYLELVTRESARVKLIDGTQGIDTVEQLIWKLVSDVIQ